MYSNKLDGKWDEKWPTTTASECDAFESERVTVLQYQTVAEVLCSVHGALISGSFASRAYLISKHCLARVWPTFKEMDCGGRQRHTTGSIHRHCI